MIGDSACGKSSLTIRLTDDKFSAVHDVTIAAEIGSKILPVGTQNQHIKLQIWDTAGQEHFRAVTRSYFRNAAGCLLVYDVTRRETFINAQNWLDDIRNQAPTDIVICLVGNKLDLAARDEEGDESNSKRQVSTQEAQEWAERNNIHHFVETSAKTGDNVLKAYEHVAQNIYDNIVAGACSQGVKANTTQTVNLNGAATKQGRCC